MGARSTQPASAGDASDSLGADGRRVRDDGSIEVFTEPLPDGSIAVGLLTRGEGTATVTTTSMQVDLSGGCSPTDLGIGGTSSASKDAGATVLTWDCHTADHQLWSSWDRGEIRLRRQEPGRSQPRHHQQHPVIGAAPPMPDSHSNPRLADRTGRCA